jgi:hypothetical protein
MAVIQSRAPLRIVAAPTVVGARAQAPAPTDDAEAAKVAAEAEQEALPKALLLRALLALLPMRSINDDNDEKTRNVMIAADDIINPTLILFFPTLLIQPNFIPPRISSRHLRISNSHIIQTMLSTVTLMLILSMPQEQMYQYIIQQTLDRQMAQLYHQTILMSTHIIYPIRMLTRMTNMDDMTRVIDQVLTM